MNDKIKAGLWVVGIVGGLMLLATIANNTSDKDTQGSTFCHPNYSGCLKVGAGDYDCRGGSGDGPNFTGRVQVYGADPFGLDRDGNGIGCE